MTLELLTHQLSHQTGARLEANYKPKMNYSQILLTTNPLVDPIKKKIIGSLYLHWVDNPMKTIDISPIINHSDIGVINAPT